LKMTKVGGTLLSAPCTSIMATTAGFGHARCQTVGWPPASGGGRNRKFLRCLMATFSPPTTFNHVNEPADEPHVHCAYQTTTPDRARSILVVWLRTWKERICWCWW
jgi:hypothetical protein